MAKIAILSDIHSNVDALMPVLEKCKEVGVDNYVSLGDIVGYNADPQECLDIVRNLNCIAMVRGNHDEYTAKGHTELSGFNPVARQAVEWTRNQLNEADRQWLINNDYRSRIPGSNSTIVHATLDTPENWGYIFDCHHATDNFSYQFTQLCFCGHSHVPVAFHKKPIASMNEHSVDEIPEWVYNFKNEIPNENFNYADELTVRIRAGYKYLFNIGSIGQPRNRDPRASFAILDTNECTVTRYRIPYNIEAQRHKILEAGLPRRLADRIVLGV